MRPAAFDLKLTHNERVATISIAGELDVRTLGELGPLVEDALGRVGTVCLVLDLRQLAFMDSSGLRLLIDLHDRASQEPWDLRLIAPQAEEAMLVLSVTGADRALPFESFTPTTQGRKAPSTGAIRNPALEIQLDRNPAAPATARGAISSYCDQVGIGPQTRATVLLLVSEVVTNAVIHPETDPGTKIGLKTNRSKRCLRVEVTDHGHGFTPTPRDPSRVGAATGSTSSNRRPPPGASTNRTATRSGLRSRSPTTEDG
jgi:anti-anti-sigma factor